MKLNRWLVSVRKARWGLPIVGILSLSAPWGAVAAPTGPKCEPLRDCSPKGCNSEATCCVPTNRLCFAAAMADLRADTYGSEGVFNTLSGMSVFSRDIHAVADAAYSKKLGQVAEKIAARCGVKGLIGDMPTIATACNGNPPFSIDLPDYGHMTFGADMTAEQVTDALTKGPKAKKPCAAGDPLASACNEQISAAVTHEKYHYSTCKNRPDTAVAALKWDLQDEVDAYKNEAKGYRDAIKAAKESCRKFRKPKPDKPPPLPDNYNRDIPSALAGARAFRNSGPWGR